MKLVLLLVADYANVTGENKLNVMGIFNEISANSFPARHSSMHLVAKFLGELGEYGDTRDVKIKLLNPDGKEILGIDGSAVVPKPEGGRTPEINLILGLRDVVFPSPGPYQFVVMVDKDYKGDIPIYLTEVAKPAEHKGE